MARILIPSATKRNQAIYDLESDFVDLDLSVERWKEGIRAFDTASTTPIKAMLQKECLDRFETTERLIERIRGSRIILGSLGMDEYAITIMDKAIDLRYRAMEELRRV